MEVHEQWKNLFDRDVLKDSIQMLALYITVYELLESTVISNPKDFFTVIDWDDKAKREYHEHVLTLYNPKAIPGINGRRKDIISSLLWFKSSGAIDDNDIQVFTDSKRLRNTLAHKMFESIADGGSKVVEQFSKMYTLFCKIERWWIMEIEVPISGDFEPGHVDEDDVMSGNMVMLNIVMDILANNSNAKYKDLCDMIGVPVK